MSFLSSYKILCLVSVLFDAILTSLLSFLYGHKVFYVINVCCCCRLILLFVLSRFLNIGISHQSNASFLRD